MTEEQEKGTKKKPRTQDETQRRIEELKVSFIRGEIHFLAASFRVCCG